MSGNIIFLDPNYYKGNNNIPFYTTSKSYDSFNINPGYTIANNNIDKTFGNYLNDKNLNTINNYVTYDNNQTNSNFNQIYYDLNGNKISREEYMKLFKLDINDFGGNSNSLENNNNLYKIQNKVENPHQNYFDTFNKVNKVNIDNNIVYNDYNDYDKYFNNNANYMSGDDIYSKTFNEKQKLSINDIYKNSDNYSHGRIQTYLPNEVKVKEIPLTSNVIENKNIKPNNVKIIPNKITEISKSNNAVINNNQKQLIQNNNINNQNNNKISNNIVNQPKNINNNKVLIPQNNINVANNENVNTMNKINITNNNNANNIPGNNINQVNNNLISQSNPNEKRVIVTKLTDTPENSPPPTPIKKRPLNNKDLSDIILKDIGIINLGNTCFINSCLQVLIHSSSFIYKFFNKISLLNQKDTPISFGFWAICHSIMNTVNTQEKYIDISYFINLFVLKHPTFGGFIQNDSQEFCRVLLEDLSTELNEVKNKAIYKTLTNTDKKTKVDRDKEFDKNFGEREKSIIVDVFYSQIITTFTCECKSETYSFQKILDFPLLLPENVPEVSIINLLTTYFQTETVEFGTVCEKCNKVLKHQKQIRITRPPEILILSLQRIDEKTQKKNECIVTFPHVLDMSQFIDHECGFDKEPFYILYAVINHQGKMDFGHYFSYIKINKENDWYEFNDSAVRKIGKDIQSFPYAYALFFIKLRKIEK